MHSCAALLLIAVAATAVRQEALNSKVQASACLGRPPLLFALPLTGNASPTPALRSTDPHPGNLLRTRDGKLAYLDFGMMGQVDATIRRWVWVGRWAGGCDSLLVGARKLWSSVVEVGGLHGGSRLVAVLATLGRYPSAGA